MYIVKKMTKHTLKILRVHLANFQHSWRGWYYCANLRLLFFLVLFDFTIVILFIFVDFAYYTIYYTNPIVKIISKSIVKIDRKHKRLMSFKSSTLICFCTLSGTFGCNLDSVHWSLPDFFTTILKAFNRIGQLIW